MLKFFLLIMVAVSCKELEHLRLKNKKSSTKNLRLTVSYIGSDNCRRYLKKQGRSDKGIELVVARNEKFGRYTTHLLGGENGDFAGINKRGLVFSGDKFFADDYQQTQPAGIRSAIIKSDKAKKRQRLLSMKTIETNCRRLLVNIYSPDHRPVVLTYPGTVIYSGQLQRFQEDFADDFGAIDCGAGYIEPCSFAEIKGWYFLYVMPDVDNFVKLSINTHSGSKEHLSIYGLIGYLLPTELDDPPGNLHLRIAKTTIQQQLTELDATTLEVRVNCQDKNWQEAKVYHLDDLNGRSTSLKINARDLIEYFNARKFSNLGKRHQCYRPGLDPTAPQNLWLFWQDLHLQFSFVTLGQPPRIYRYRFESDEQWNDWFNGRGTIVASADDGKQLLVLLTAP